MLSTAREFRLLRNVPPLIEHPVVIKIPPVYAGVGLDYCRGQGNSEFSRSACETF